MTAKTRRCQAPFSSAQASKVGCAPAGILLSRKREQSTSWWVSVLRAQQKKPDAKGYDLHESLCEHSWKDWPRDGMGSGSQMDQCQLGTGEGQGFPQRSQPSESGRGWPLCCIPVVALLHTCHYWENCSTKKWISLYINYFKNTINFSETLRHISQLWCMDPESMK